MKEISKDLTVHLTNSYKYAIEKIRNTTINHNIRNNLPSFGFDLSNRPSIGYDNQQEVAVMFLQFQLDCAFYHHFIEKDSNKAKEYFYKYARLTEFLIKKYDKPVLTYGRDYFDYTMSSDNLKSIEAFGKSSFRKFLSKDYNYWVEEGTCALIYALQCIINDNIGECKKAVKIVEEKCLKENPTLFLDVEFLSKMIEKDKRGIESVLLSLLKPDIHQQRNNTWRDSQLISHPALGYAKLAWYKGIEVEVDSPLVPKEWLPIKPLKAEAYVDYDFVKAYLG